MRSYAPPLYEAHRRAARAAEITPEFLMNLRFTGTDDRGMLVGEVAPTQQVGWWRV